MKSNKKVNVLLWLDYVAVAIIVIAFFVISYCGFFYREDISMNYGVSTIFDVLMHTKNWYFTLGGRLFSVASQYMFSGVLGDNKIWFDIVNTMFFVLLILTCGKMINNKDSVFYVLLFALLFWFLCPAPSESLFWVGGSTTYLWANTLSFVYLLFFLKYKDSDFSVLGKIGLCIISFFAATEFITCASICGAFVVYYAFHIKKFKGNAVPFVIGFVIGSLVLLFAPGNFIRATKGIGDQSLFGVRDLLQHPLLEMIKYKALWMLLIVIAWGWRNNKTVVKTWVKSNIILLLSLGWSIVAFSVVLRPMPRALFFTETLSLVLFLRFLFENYQVLGIPFLDKIISHKNSYVWRAIFVLLFFVLIMDSVFAISETKKQSKNNDVLLNEIADSRGAVALDYMISSHRMAYSAEFPEFTWEPLADRFGLDSVHIYPYYCQDKYYKHGAPLENVYVDVNDNNRYNKEVCMIVRIENEDLHEAINRIVFTIDYTRPRKWYRLWLDKWRNYQYDRTVIVERDNPDVCFDGYCYYVFWLKRENAKNLKSVKYEIE